MVISIDNRQADLELDKDWVVCLSEEIMGLLNLTEYELSISFVAADEMSQLNEKYLNKKGTTDVLAFPLADEPDTDTPKKQGRQALGKDILGDVVICPSHFGRPGVQNSDEIVKLLVHGILHLAGYDHQKPQDKKEMFCLQDEIIEKITS